MKTKQTFAQLSTLWLGVLTLATASMAADKATDKAVQEYDLDPSHSEIGFTIRHMVSKVPGSFGKFDAKIAFDPKMIDKSHVEITIAAESINTHNEKRDKHLRNEDFFDVDKFPEIKFISKKFKPAGKDKYKLEGDLTLHGITKPVKFDVVYNGMVKDPWGNMRAGFQATTEINRKDFGIIWNKVLDAGSLMLGETVAVSVQLEATQKK